MEFLTGRQVNTLMAGTYKARSMRGKYSQAGYAHDDQLYIADVPAGSKQDELRDFNRAGYRSERPWNETPYPVFEGQSAEIAAPMVRSRKPAKKSFVDVLIAQAKREPRDVIACFVLLAMMMMMGAAWGQNLIRSTEIQHAINNYQASTVAFERENERLAQKLELARGGERIRNLAQNELGMLRPERAMTQKIYIQTSDLAAHKTVQNSEEPRMELLDILLGLLNVFHIGE